MSWCYARHKYFPSITCVTLDKYPVLLLHGLLQASGTFCVNDESSLAFYLCKSGYDVWLGNNRGYFKPEHRTLKPSDPKFWAWNLQEMASLDLPAMVSFVCAKTNHEKVAHKITNVNFRLRLLHIRRVQDYHFSLCQKDKFPDSGNHFPVLWLLRRPSTLATYYDPSHSASSESCQNGFIESFSAFTH